MWFSFVTQGRGQFNEVLQKDRQELETSTPKNVNLLLAGTYRQHNGRVNLASEELETVACINLIR